MKPGMLLAMLLLFSQGLHVANVRAEQSVRIKDISQINGEHSNLLTGYGLITGLAGTGGTSPTTKMFAINVLQNLGMRGDPRIREVIQSSPEKTNNMSVVMLQAELPAHIRKGQKIDLNVSAFDDAKSLQGGILLRSELKGPDGQVYVLAGGPISVNGGSFGGQAATVVKNHPTAGRIVGTVETDVVCEVLRDDRFQLLLNHPDYTTARRVATAVNQLYPGSAEVLDPATIEIFVSPAERRDPFAFIAGCQNLRVVPDRAARVVINERTGTVVFGENVRLSRIAIAHGSLIVSTLETPEVSQPNPLSEGETTTVPRTSVGVQEQQASINVLNENASVADLAASLNALGVSPRDLSSIFQMLHEEGALHAELELE